MGLSRSGDDEGRGVAARVCGRPSGWVEIAKLAGPMDGKGETFGFLRHALLLYGNATFTQISLFRGYLLAYFAYFVNRDLASGPSLPGRSRRDSFCSLAVKSGCDFSTLAPLVPLQAC